MRKEEQRVKQRKMMMTMMVEKKERKKEELNAKVTLILTKGHTQRSSFRVGKLLKGGETSY